MLQQVGVAVPEGERAVLRQAPCIHSSLPGGHRVLGGSSHVVFLFPLHPSEHDELREIFNDISSSSEDEDERDHHDDEDLNIMDTEEDLERQLQDKLNESDGQQQENEGSNQIGELGGRMLQNRRGKNLCCCCRSQLTLSSSHGDPETDRQPEE